MEKKGKKKAASGRNKPVKAAAGSVAPKKAATKKTAPKKAAPKKSATKKTAGSKARQAAPKKTPVPMKAAARRPAGRPTAKRPPKKELLLMRVADLRALARSLGFPLSARIKSEIVEEIIIKSRKASSSAKAVTSPKTPASKKTKAKAATKPASRKKTASPGKAPAAREKTGPGPGRTTVTLKPVSELILEKKKPEARPTGYAKTLLASAITTPSARQRQRPSMSSGAPLLEKALGKGLKAEEPGFAPEPLPATTDMVNAMPVSAGRIFVTWDLTAASASRGPLCLRLHDVTGVLFDGRNSLGYRDVSIEGASGQMHLDVTPGRQYVVDLGALDQEGRFVSIRQSGVVRTPEGRASEGESQLPEEYFTYRPRGYGQD